MNEYYLPYEAHASGLPLTRNPRDVTFNPRLFHEIAFIASNPQNRNFKGISPANQLMLDAILRKEQFPELERLRLSSHSRTERIIKEHLDHYISLKKEFPNGWGEDSN